MESKRKALMKSAFENCMVIGQKINFFKQFSYEELLEIYDQFSMDLLDNNIPHYRVVGIYYGKTINNFNVFTALDKYDRSLIEISQNVSKIIPDVLDNSDLLKFCRQEDIDEMAPMMKASFIEPGAKKNIEFGQLNFVSGYLRNVEDNPDIDQDSVIYRTWSRCDDSLIKHPNYLVKDFKVCEASISSKAGFTSEETVFYYMLGTGSLTYAEANELFNPVLRIMPVAAEFALSPFITCKYPLQGCQTDGLDLCYFDSINEETLTGILRNYAKGFGE